MWQHLFKLAPMNGRGSKRVFTLIEHTCPWMDELFAHVPRCILVERRAGEKRAPRPRRRLRNARNGIPRSQLRSHLDLTRPYSGLVVIAFCLFATTTASAHLYAYATARHSLYGYARRTDGIGACLTRASSWDNDSGIECMYLENVSANYFTIYFLHALLKRSRECISILIIK